MAKILIIVAQPDFYLRNYGGDAAVGLGTGMGSRRSGGLRTGGILLDPNFMQFKGLN